MRVELHTDRDECSKEFVFHGFRFDVLPTDVLLQTVLRIWFEYLVKLNDKTNRPAHSSTEC